MIVNVELRSTEEQKLLRVLKDTNQLLVRALGISRVLALPFACIRFS